MDSARLKKIIQDALEKKPNHEIGLAEALSALGSETTYTVLDSHMQVCFQTDDYDAAKLSADTNEGLVIEGLIVYDPEDEHGE